MRKFITKVQELGKKAVEIQQAIHAAPAKAAEIREALTMSAGEFYQLRADVQSSVNGLRATNEDRLLQAMREVNDSTYTFEEAGYELTGMDLDLTLTQRLAIRLQKFEDVPHVKLRALITKEVSETIQSILSGLLKAEESAANVELTHLKYDGVIVHIGAIPLVRMSWRSDTLLQEEIVAPVVETKSTPLLPASPASGSFFEQRTIPGSQSVSSQTSTAIATEPAAAPLKTISEPESQQAPASPWSASALDRFKKMPNLSKHR
jgi:hypothetical protein